MRRLFLGLIGVLALCVWIAASEAAPESAASSEPSSSTTYEIQINGETFLVDGNRQTKLKSKEKPGVTYDVAIRVAPMQRKRLKTVEFLYNQPAKADVLGNVQNPSLRISHELGYSILVGDLGRGLDAKEQDETLNTLEQSVVATLRESKAQDIKVTEPHQRTFAGSPARGKTIRFVDSSGRHRVCLLYVLAGPKHAATCVVEYLENDSDDVLPLVRQTLDSIRPLAESR